MSEFSGFSRDLPTFLGELRENNSKAWFDENRQRYESVYLEPAKAFVAAIAPDLHRISPAISAEPRVNGAVMRVNRDIRFSRDKTPYKTTMDIHFVEGTTKLKSNPAYLFRFTAEAFHIGVGAHGFNKAQLAAWREALVDDKTGKAFRAALSAASKAGYSDPGGQHYKTVPRGLPADHPNAEFLRFNMFYLTREESPAPDALFAPEAVDYCLSVFQALRPVQEWLVSQVGDRS